MDEYEFEHFVAKLWEKQGWQTEVTSGSRDQGIDVIARQRNPSRKCLIQAKKYSEQNNVGAREVREYAGLYQQEKDVDEVIVVTTSGFTKQAKEIGRKTNVTLLDGSDVEDVIERNGGEALTDEADGYTADLLIAGVFAIVGFPFNVFLFGGGFVESIWFSLAAFLFAFGLSRFE